MYIKNLGYFDIISPSVCTNLLMHVLTHITACGFYTLQVMGKYIGVKGKSGGLVLWLPSSSRRYEIYSRDDRSTIMIALEFQMQRLATQLTMDFFAHRIGFMYDDDIRLAIT